MVVMQFRRALALGTMALALFACSARTAVLPTTSTSSTVTTSTVTTSTVLTIGEVCGVTALGGGPETAVGVKDRALLHRCPFGPHKVTTSFSILASNGRRYRPYLYSHDGWTARLPAGTYRAVGAAGCPGAQGRFVITAGRTLIGVVVWFGCDYF
jgi:hypothetical protein